MSQLVQVLPKSQIGLYRDDGLAVSSASRRQNDMIKKKICRILETNGLSITIDVNVKVVSFLDITLDLSTCIYKPFMKENDHPVYVDVKSNHHPMVLKYIPMGVNRKLNRISSNKEVFDNAKEPFQEALSKSGYKHVLEYAPTQNAPKKQKTRSKPITWFNPPFSLNVKSQVGKEFLSLLDTSFPPDNPLHKLFTRYTVKISYRRMPNMAQAVSFHNAKLLRDDNGGTDYPPCNCRGGPQSCPVGGSCQAKGVVYEATVTELASGSKETYTGVTARRFKDRLYEHRTDMSKTANRTNSSLALHIWNLKDRGLNYDVKWKIKARGTKFNPSTKKCRICLKEKHFILYKREGATLNNRREIFNTCTHRWTSLLSKLKKTWKT